MTGRVPASPTWAPVVPRQLAPSPGLRYISLLRLPPRRDTRTHAAFGGERSGAINPPLVRPATDTRSSALPLFPPARTVLPTLLTTANALSGLWAIYFALADHPARAAWCVILAALWDGLDGASARWGQGPSPFGRELDSLADLVSFGVAPVVIIFTGVLGDGPIWTWGLACSFPLAGLYRLARYNTEGRHGDEFKGLAITSAGVTVALAYLAYLSGPAGWWAEAHFTPLYLALLLLLAGLMVSDLPYPDQTAVTQALDGRWWIPLIALGLGLLILKVAFLFLVSLGYVLWSPMRRATMALWRPGHTAGPSR